LGGNTFEPGRTEEPAIPPIFQGFAHKKLSAASFSDFFEQKFSKKIKP
jgi:hypothetical protein